MKKIEKKNPYIEWDIYVYAKKITCKHRSYGTRGAGGSLGVKTYVTNGRGIVARPDRVAAETITINYKSFPPASMSRARIIQL